jgi:hypothetical protein
MITELRCGIAGTRGCALQLGQLDARAEQDPSQLYVPFPSPTGPQSVSLPTPFAVQRAIQISKWSRTQQEPAPHHPLPVRKDRRTIEFGVQGEPFHEHASGGILSHQRTQSGNEAHRNRSSLKILKVFE